MSETIATDSLFSVEEQTMLRTLAGMIVGASSEHSVPGADDDRIFADILACAADVEEPIRTALAFASECSEPLADAVDELEGRVEMAALVSLVMQCYYRDDRVMESLDMEPRPPFPLGYEVPEGDWSMLEAVQARGKIWRDA